MNSPPVSRALVAVLLLHLINVGHAQVQLMSILDPSWIEQFQNVVNNVRRLELESLYFKLPFEDKDINQVQFHLYTAKNPSRSQLLFPNDSSRFGSSHFQKGQPTKILIHGYAQTKNSFDFPRQVKDAYLHPTLNPNSSHNVISVDWSVLSKEINYFDSANYTIHVGEYIAQFLIGMKSMGYVGTFNELHLVGFSLGAHVAGVVGHYISEETKRMEKIGRITGLDPAQPGFLYAPEMQRLDSEDADFVDVIHTNMGSILTGDLGMSISSGHADFFPNGGRKQPACEFSLFTEYSIPRRSTCSHVKAAEYFAQSILGHRYASCGCRSWESFKQGFCDCLRDKGDEHGDNEGGRDRRRDRQNVNDSIVLMGEHCDQKARGDFYLVVR